MTSTRVAAANYLKQQMWVVALYGVSGSGRCQCGKAKCGAPGQHPRGKRRQSARHWPDDANVGAMTGRESGLLALAAEGRAGQETVDLLRAGGFDLGPPAFANRRWRFWLHKSPGSDLRLQSVMIDVGLECRAEGGCIPLPPSRIQGGVLTWKRPTNEELATAPAWLVERAFLKAPRDGNVLDGAFHHTLVLDHSKRHPFEDGWTRLMRRHAEEVDK